MEGEGEAEVRKQCMHSPKALDHLPECENEGTLLFELVWSVGCLRAGCL